MTITVILGFFIGITENLISIGCFFEFGTQVEVPTIDGRAKIKIPPGTQSGKIFRLKGKGFPEVQGYSRGDQLIHVNVWTPQHLSADEKAILEKLNNSDNFKPNPNKGDKSFFERVREAFS